MNRTQKQFSRNRTAQKCKCPSVILFGALLFGEVFSFAQSPPLNDNFENRIVLTGSPVTFTGTLLNATIQSGEPMANSLGSSWPYPYYAKRQAASVWWSWAANSSGPVTFEVLNSSTNTIKLGAIDAWVGTNWSSGFDLAGGIDLDIGRHPFFTFSATAGTTYQLRVVGTNHGDFTLRITETNTPIVVIQPHSRTVSTNGSVFFGVIVAGKLHSSPPFSYQWRFNGLDLPGETFPILSFDNLATNQSGGYSVVVSNALNGIISDTAILKVTEATASPTLAPLGSANGQFRFGILGETGRLYLIQSSTNLVNWFEEKGFPKQFAYYDSEGVRARTGVVYQDGNPYSVRQASQQGYYRTIPYVPSLAACINNLAKIRFAKEIWSLETKKLGHYTPTSADILIYMKSVPLCPSGGTNLVYDARYINNQLTANPLCQMSLSHLLEEPEN
jgi:hypothetical protein